jgi:hypothetical protein
MQIVKINLLLAVVGFALVLSGPVRADFSSTDSKHPHGRMGSGPVVDYGRFEWLADGDQSNAAVNRIIISLADQRLYAFHDHQLLAWSNVSTGRSGYETPTGDFSVSEKDVDHHSSLYEDASMPYFMRLTDSGVGMHAGWLPGYPASHGCVRLPFGMAQKLYDRVDSGTPVQIVSSSVDLAAQEKSSVPVKLAQE